MWGPSEAFLCLLSLMKTLFIYAQTVRIWEFQSGETKFELRGHENAVEAVAFAPISAYPAIRELAGIAVSAPHLHVMDTDTFFLLRRIDRNSLDYSSRLVREIKSSRSGMRQPDNLFGHWSVICLIPFLPSPPFFHPPGAPISHPFKGLAHSKNGAHKMRDSPRVLSFWATRGRVVRGVSASFLPRN